jgi:hypothetical protein
MKPNCAYSCRYRKSPHEWGGVILSRVGAKALPALSVIVPLTVKRVELVRLEP